MSRFELTSRAAADLLEIVRYTGDKWGDVQADRYMEELHLALQRLSLTPDLGRKRDAIAPRLRSAAVAQHVAFYSKRRNTILVLRILHPRMDVEGSLEG